MDVVNKALNTLEEDLEEKFSNFLNKILITTGVIPSLEIGLLGPKDQLDVGGDGTLVPSQVNTWGKSTCKCFKEGWKTTCNCDRKYSDPTTTWGWDHTHKVFVFGYKIHALVVKHNESELPIHLNASPAHPADIIMGINAIVSFYKFTRELNIDLAVRAYIFDSAYDAVWFYRLIVELGSKPVIALNPKNNKAIEDQSVPRDEKTGNPVCPGGAICRHHIFDKQKQKHVWHCPAKRPSRKKGKRYMKVFMESCPNGKLYEPESKMGPIYNIPIHKDYRANPPIPRSSDLHTKLYKKRTATERFNSAFKSKLSRPYRREHLTFIHIMASSLSFHGVARVKHKLGDVKPASVSELLEQVHFLTGPDNPTAAAA